MPGGNRKNSVLVFGTFSGLERGISMKSIFHGFIVFDVDLSEFISRCALPCPYYRINI